MVTSPDMETIYTEYHAKVMGYIAARVQQRADAEDLCSDVFEKIYRRLDEYDSSKAALGTWIFTITRNTLIDYFRRKRPQAELDENMADDSEVDESLLTGETLQELAAALQRMPERLREIIILRYHDGKTLTEIAKMMDLSYGAVKLRHQNALQILREALQIEE